MWFSRSNFQKRFCVAGCFAGLATVIGMTGCGNTCFVGVVDNGNGSGTVKVGGPPRSCSAPTPSPVWSGLAVKSPPCETCTSAARVEHAFVTLRSIQLRRAGFSDANAADWLEIAPQLASEPRQIDLMGNSAPEILVERAVVPAGIYREVRLQFLSNSPTDRDTLRAQNNCGGLRNCVVVADGHVEPLRLAGDASEMVINIQSADGESSVALPGSRMELRLHLQPQQEFYFSGTGELKLQRVLAGHAIAARRSSPDEASTSH